MKKSKFTAEQIIDKLREAGFFSTGYSDTPSVDLWLKYLGKHGS